MTERSWVARLVLVAGTAGCSAAPPAPTSATSHRAPIVLQDRSRIPESAPERPYVPPTVLERRLANGVRILVVERRELPVVHVSFLVRRGSADAAPGVAERAVAALRDAASPLPGVKFRVWTNYDAIGISVIGYTNPNYTTNLPEETFTGFAELLQTGGRSSEQMPLRPSVVPGEPSEDDRTALARLERMSLYPGDHPYHHMVAGGAANAPDASVVSRFFDEHVRPDQVVAIAVGDVALESFLDSIHVAFGRWQGRARARAPLPEPIRAPLGGAPVTLIDRPGVAASTIVVAARAVPWTSPDYYPLWILSELLGGAFDSRLNQNLRETNAYSYSSTTSLGTFRGTAPFEVMGLATPENTADAMREMKTEVERVRTEALARDEIERVKRAAIRRIPMMFSTLAATLQSVETLAAYDRPANDYSTLASAIERVSVADVERVARVYLAPDQLRWFVVADASMVRKSIEATSAPLQVVVAETPKTRNVPSAETRSPPK